MDCKSPPSSQYEHAVVLATLPTSSDRLNENNRPEALPVERLKLAVARQYKDEYTWMNRSLQERSIVEYEFVDRLEDKRPAKPVRLDMYEKTGHHQWQALRVSE